jgi:hypothetical protein
MGFLVLVTAFRSTKIQLFPPFIHSNQGCILSPMPIAMVAIFFGAPWRNQKEDQEHSQRSNEG